ncbi:MAG TPA: hypothetical protein VII61_23035 [Ktedonobacteraceae bacterium]
MFIKTLYFNAEDLSSTVANLWNALLHTLLRIACAGSIFYHIVIFCGVSFIAWKVEQIHG